MAHIATSNGPASFAVTPESLNAGAALIPVPEHVALPPTGAAAGTPAAGAWTAFAASLARFSTKTDDSISALRSALETAANDYTTADATAAKGFGLRAA